METDFFVCKHCQKTFKGKIGRKTNWQTPPCPKCKNKNTRFQTPLEMYHRKKQALMV